MFTHPDKTVQGWIEAARPASSVPKLSTPEDVDHRTGERRLLEDDYRLHADHVDTVRLGLRDHVIAYTAYLQLEDRTAPVWIGELWAIERACRALGIED